MIGIWSSIGVIVAEGFLFHVASNAMSGPFCQVSSTMLWSALLTLHYIAGLGCGD